MKLALDGDEDTCFSSPRAPDKATCERDAGPNSFRDRFDAMLASQRRFRYIVWITPLFIRPMASFQSSLGTGLLLTVTLLIAYSYVQDRRRNPSRLPYPPGPKGYPIIGNLLDIPNAFIYKRFRKMSRELGMFYVLKSPFLDADEPLPVDSDIIHLQVFGFHLIVCNSKGVADDLLDKRSSIYSDR